jgi:hypothetical protein
VFTIIFPFIQLLKTVLLKRSKGKRERGRGERKREMERERRRGVNLGRSGNTVGTLLVVVVSCLCDVHVGRRYSCD